jgi:DNA-binding response OmpR family regulator
VTLPGDERVVLIVDDEPLLLKVRELILRGQGYDVRTATNANDALRLFKADGIDLVITDHLLPGRTGSEMAAEMKCINPHVKIMLLTGMPEPPEGSESVMDDYVTKGTRVPLFLERVAALLNPSDERTRRPA